jgi:ribose-phosphate pyrophosphokinase
MPSMKLTPEKTLVVVAGRGHRELAEDVVEHLNTGLSEVILSTFANGEIYCRFGESIRGSDVFVFQSHCDPINDRLMEQLIMIDAAKRASAKRITAVCPFYGYARQDRKAEGREPITARLVADMLSAAGADRVVSVDLHTGQIQGFFDFPVDHLTAVPVIAEYLASALDGDVTVVSPDAGGGKLAHRYATQLEERTGLDIELAFIDKRRPKGVHNVAVATEVVGEIEGRVCVLVDDMIDTAGTVVSAANLLVDRGATDVLIAATHGLLSGPAVDRLKNGPIREVIVSNTLPISDDKQFDSLRVMSIAPLLAGAIDAIFCDGSVSGLFGGDNL